MIEGFVGMPGQGKTYLMVRKALKAMKKGKKVYANFTLRGAEKYEHIGEIFEVKNAIILVDEASLVLPAQAWKEIPFSVLARLRQHRHDGVEMWWTAQDFQDIASGLRRVTQFVNRCGRLGSPKTPFIFYWKTFDNRFKAKYGGGWHLFDKDIASAYNTHDADVIKQSFIQDAYGEKYRKNTVGSSFDAKA